MNYIFKRNGDNSPIVLFLHGWGCDLHSFDSVAEFLYGYGYSTLQIDFAGFGKSPEPKSTYSVPEYADDVAILLKSLNIKSVCIIAHSFGGRVALVLQDKVNISKLVLTCSAGLKPKFSLKTKYNVLKYKLCKLLIKSGKRDKKTLDSFGSDDYKNLSDNMKQVFVRVVNLDLKEKASEITCPTLLYWGKYDKETPIYMAKKFHKLIPDNTLIIVDYSHFAFIENNFDFCNKVLEFFKK